MSFGVFVVPDAIEPFPALNGIVHHQLNAVDARERDDAVPLESLRNRTLLAVWNRHALGRFKLAAENLGKEIAVSTGRFEKSAVYPLRLVLHEIEHRVYLARSGKHLAALCNSLA